MPLARPFASRSWRSLSPAYLLVLGCALIGTVSLQGAVGTVQISGEKALTARKPSPSLASLPAPKAAGPLRILLVDDDWSDNNVPEPRKPSPGSDTFFRELVAAAVGGNASSWAVDVVPQNQPGPTLERLRNFNVVVWYTGASYGGGPDNTSTLGLEDEKTVRRYLEEVGGAFILLSPGYLTNLSYATTWTESPQAFLREIVGINGFRALAHRFSVGQVTALDGTTYTLQAGAAFTRGAKGVIEPQISAVNPDGAAIVFTSTLDPNYTAPGASAVAVANPHRGGRFVYVGFTLENIDTPERARAFNTVLAAAGISTAPAPTLATTSTPSPTVSPTRTPVVALGGVTPTIKPTTLTPVMLKDVEFDNWGFERGLTGWTKEGTAFDRQPTFGDNVLTTRVLTHMEFNQGGVGGDYWKNQGYPNGNKGRFWIGTYENNPGGAGSTFGATQGDAPIGSLTSPEFEITQSQCYFLLGGGSDANALKVELQTKQADATWKTEATRTSFRNSELMYRENFPLAALKGKIARIRIVDGSTGNWGHINVDDFQFRNDVFAGITLTDPGTNRSYLVDADYPVWGIADTHAHPAHNNGFGNRLVVGKADDPLSVAYSHALCHAHHSNLGTGAFNTMFIGGGDPHPIMLGWPDFIGFPRFNSKTHQQQHVDFLKRAWQGGMRLISALAVNNMYLPSLALGPGHDGAPYDDDSVVLRQLQDLKNMAAGQSSWLEIAYTPKDARRIVLQGKCAMVLGIEVDNFGNFKVPSYNWNDAVNPANSRLVALTPSNAEQLLTDKVNQYYNLGIRQFTPMHYLSGTFGGAAIFRGQIALIQFAFNNTVSVKRGVDRRIPFTLADDYSVSMAAAGVPPSDYLMRIQGNGIPGTINALGMTDFGRKLATKLMDKGVMLDSEHMGYEMKEELFALAAQRNYPVMSSHTDPAGLGYTWLGTPTLFQGSPEDKMRNFGTTNIRNLITEFNLADEHYQRIKQSGGTVGVFMLPYLKKPYQGYWGSIANDCAGSSKTWAQMYLYSLDKMDGKGVALCTDRGMTDFIAPRFGPNAGYTLADETLPRMKKDARAVQRTTQTNGVKYDRPMGSFHISWYHQADGAAIDEHENDAWIALAAIEANVPTTSTPPSFYVANLARVTNYVKGYRAANESELEPPFLINGDSPWEQAAMFCVRNGRDPSSLAAYRNYNTDQKNRLNAIHAAILPAWRTWNNKYGNNEPLRRARTGNRDWDFNTDGMAHYGLMPDFLQDLRNIGLSPGSLTPLFRSTEDYLQMWEKSVKSSGAPQ
jgi:microsomal dipeptidase-like Zn-dependent dipeptidase